MPAIQTGMNGIGDASMLDAIFAGMKDVFLVVDDDGRVLYANPEATEKLGYTARELTALRMVDLHPESARQEVETAFCAMLDGERHLRPLPLLTKWGAEIPTETKVWRGRWNGSECTFAISRDLTDEHDERRRLECIISGTDAGTWEWNTQSGDVVVNDRWARMLGYEPAELGRIDIRTWARLIHPDDRRKAIVELRRHFTGEFAHFDCSLRMRHKDGRWIWMRSHGQVVHWRDGAPLTMFGTNTDISEIKKVEDELNSKVEELDRYFSLSLDLLCIASSDARFIRLNPEWETTLGYAIKSLEGRPFLDLIHPEDRAATLAAVAKLNGQEEVTGFENRYRHEDGSYRWLEWRSRPSAGKIYAVARDVTRRKRMESALARSERRFRLAVEATNDGLWEWDLTSDLVEWSPRCFTMLGYAPGEFSTSFEEWQAKVHPRDREGATKVVLDSLRKGEAFANEFRFLCKDGSWRWLLGRGKVVDWDDAGKPIRMIGTHTDIDAMKQAEAALIGARIEAEQANRAKSEFLANMSHELRTPLNSILGFSEVMMQGLYGPLGSPRYVEYVRDVHDSGRLLLEIINDILDLSRVEVGAVRLEEKRVDLKDILLSLNRILRQRAAEAGLSFSTDVKPGTPYLTADPLRLKQILLNLASNAVKFTKRDGQVSVSASRDEAGGVMLSVSDTGIGMTEEGIAIALRPFGQVAAAQRRGHKGTGLGLPIAKSLAELHGATLEIRSTPGVGTTIDVRFPPERSFGTVT